MVRELTEERSETSKTFLLSDGSKQAIINQEPVHFRDEGGPWQEINKTLVPLDSARFYLSGSSEETYQSAATAVKVFISNETSATPPVRLEYEGAEVSFNLLEAQEDKKLVLGPRAAFVGVAKDTNLYYEVTDSGLKETIELTSPQAPSSFTFQVEHQGLTLLQDETGQWGFYRAGEKEPLLVLSTLFVFDSSEDAAGEPGICPGATMTVSEVEPGRSTIRYEIPREWLEDPARVYPVKVDPTVTLGTSADTYIRDVYDFPVGSADYVSVGYYDSTHGWSRGLFKFTLPASVLNRYIHSAQLKLYQYVGPATANTTHVGEMTKSWTESSTWNTVGSYTPANVKNIAVAQGQWLDLSVADTVQDWSLGTKTNYGWVIYQNNPAEGASYWRKFRSKEYSDANYRPQLVITYDDPNPYSTVEGYAKTYRLGDTVSVATKVYSVYPGDVNRQLLMVNSANGSPLRGYIGWFKAGHGVPAGWTVKHTLANGSRFATIDDPAYNNAMLEPDWAASSEATYSGYHRVTFVFKLKDEYGQVNNNSFDTKFYMGPTVSTWPWASGPTNHNTQVAVLANDVRHTSYDLGEFAEHSAQATLDKARLDVDVTDLAIASWGPPAALERTYWSSRTTAGYFALGWRFNFERRLNFVSGDQIDYVDTAGEIRSFAKVGTSWQAPHGTVATLANPAPNWTLTFKDKGVLTFDSSGKLLSEADRNGNTVTYTWGTNLLTITAANGQQIQVTLNAGGKITSASYATAAGTRTVNYATAVPWKVTYFPGQPNPLQRVAAYLYDANSRLSELQAESFRGTTTSTEKFYYNGSSPNVVLLPDSPENSDAYVSIVQGTSTATVYRRGRVRTSPSVPTGASAEIRQIYNWNVSGTPASRSNSYISPATPDYWTYTYTPQSNLMLTETSPLNETKRWTYDARANVLTEKDERDHTTTYTYPTGDTDPKRDLPSSVTDPTGAPTSYTYDTPGNLTSIIRQLNISGPDTWGSTNTSYANVTVGAATYRGAVTQEQKLITIGVSATTDFNTDGYYPNGEPKKTVHKAVKLSDAGTPLDLTITSTYDAFGNLLTETDTSGQVTATNTYDLVGRLLTSTGPAFNVNGSGPSTQIVSRYDYDRWGHEASFYRTSIAESSPQTQAEKVMRGFDLAGRLSTEQRRLWANGSDGVIQSTLTYTYDGMGREITRKDSTISGQPALTAYDSSGNVVASWEDGVTATGASYEDARATRHLDVNGNPAYDKSGRVLRTTVPGETEATVYYYYADGDFFYQTNPDGTWSYREFDAAGRVTAEYQSGLGPKTYVYDLAGRLVSQTETNDQSDPNDDLLTTFAYDCLGRQISAAAAGSPASTTTYNTLGWELKSLDADGVSKAKLYDTAGRILEETNAGQLTSSSYDQAGNLLQQIDPTDKRVAFEYDWFGRPTREHQTQSGTQTLKDTLTTYDSQGRPAARTDNTSRLTHTFTYPADTTGPTTDTFAVGQLGVGNGSVQTAITVGADLLEAGRESTIALNPGLPTITRTVDQRDDGHKPTQATLKVGATGTSILTKWGYDAAGRTDKQGGSGFSSAAMDYTAYDFDAATGKKKWEFLLLNPVGGQTENFLYGQYTYGASGRVSYARVGGVTEDQIVFGPAGNLTSFRRGGVTTTQAYDGNRIVSATTAGQTTYFGWNTEQGWRTWQGPSNDPQDPARIQYAYDDAGRLQTYVNPDSNRETTATYSYDALGQRLRSVVDLESQVTTTDFTYEGLALHRLSAAQTGGTNPTNWEITYLYDENARPYAGLYRSPNSSTSPVFFAMVTSDRGDVLSLLDADGNPFASYRYDAWGGPQGAGNLSTGIWTQATSIMSSALAADIASRQPLRYAGYNYDLESGLYYLSARYYDPATRQFLTKDPAKADGEESAYQYCGGDPVGMVDPDGRYALADRLFIQGIGWVSRGVMVGLLGAAVIASHSRSWIESKVRISYIYKWQDVGGGYQVKKHPRHPGGQEHWEWRGKGRSGQINKSGSIRHGSAIPKNAKKLREYLKSKDVNISK